MRNYIFLILILDFFREISSLACSNVTEVDSQHVCSYRLFRRKRSPEEYTRWRANIETSSEFVVKVLDEDVTTPKSGVVAVNIQPVTPTERVIIGAAITPTTLKDYTRFVPPTTASVTKIDDETFLAPVTPVKFNPTETTTAIDIKTMRVPYPPRVAPHPQRDESPPAGPYFITHNSVPDLRQFAPIITLSGRDSNTATTKCPHNKARNFKPTRTTLELKPFPSRTMFTKGLPHHKQNRNLKALHEFLVPLRTSFIKTKATTAKDADFFTKVYFTDDDFDILHTTHKIADTPALGRDRDEDSIRDQISTQFTSSAQKPPSPSPSSGGGGGGGVGGGSDFESYSNLYYLDDVEESGNKISGNSYDSKALDDHQKGTSKAPKESATPNYFDNNDDYELRGEKLAFFSTYTPHLTENTQSVNVPTESVDPKSNLESDDFVQEDTRRRISATRNCSVVKLRPVGFSCPSTLPEIEKQLKKWADSSPIAKLVDITYNNLTTMENPIYMMIVDDPSNGQILSAKETVLIIAGIHGRDHHAVTAAIYVLYQLIDRAEAHTDLLVKFRFWIIPVFNPDGYDYSMTFPQRRNWFKNLRQNWGKCNNTDACKFCTSYGLRCTIDPCFGVNLDRNFEYQWIPPEELEAEHPCGDLYAGKRQLSEVETLAITSYLQDLRLPVSTFVAFKEGSVLGVLYPYSHTKKKRAFDPVYRHRATQAATAAYAISGRPYVAGQTSEYLPLYAGGMEDWMEGHLGIDNTYTIMLYRPTDAYSPSLMTERVVHEAYAALDTLLILKTEALPQRKAQAPGQVLIGSAATRTQISISWLLVFIFSIHLGNYIYICR